MSVVNPRSQEKKRRPQRFRDEFKREWGATIEIATGCPTGPLSPMGWTPPKLGNGMPLLVPQTYFQFDPVTKPGEFWHDFARFESDVMLAEKRWNDNLSHLAKQFYGDGAMEAFTNPPQRLLEQAGPKPVFPSVLVRAMAEGNAFVLGLDPVMPQWAKAGEWFNAPMADAAIVTRAFFPSAADEQAGELVGAGSKGRGGR